MLPAWMIDKINKDDELRRRNDERHIDQPAREERGRGPSRTLRLSSGPCST